MNEEWERKDLESADYSPTTTYDEIHEYVHTAKVAYSAINSHSSMMREELKCK